MSLKIFLKDLCNFYNYHCFSDLHLCHVSFTYYTELMVFVMMAG